MIPISSCVPKLNVQTLEPKSAGSNPESPIYQLYVILDKWARLSVLIFCKMVNRGATTV